MNDEQRPLPNGWKLSEPYHESKQADYVKRVVEELKAIPRIKIPPTTTQCASTQAVLDRDPALDEQHWNRPLPAELDWKREIVERSIGPQEYETAKSAQRSSKNTVGQSELGSVDKEKRQRGIDAFTYSKPAELTPDQIKKLTKLTEIVNTPLEPEPEKPKGIWRRMFGTPHKDWHWVKDGLGRRKVEHDPD